MKKFCFLFIMLVLSLSGKAFSGLGSGTASDPYQITTPDELFEMRSELNAYYKQMNDIDLTQWIQEDNPKQGWNPIGTSTTMFKGTFDGNNYSIKGLYINRPNQHSVGLFGCADGGSIKNVTLINPHIIGGGYTGGLIGFCEKQNKKSTYIYNSVIIRDSRLIC